MYAGELMATNLRTVVAEAPLDDALAIMAEDHLTALPVVSGQGALIGVLSSTDVLQRLAETEGRERARMLDGTVGDLMTVRPAAIAPDTPVKEAAQQMLYLDVHRLFVVDGDQLVGVISQSDIARGVALARL